MAKTVPGGLHVSNDVIADLAAKSVRECYGIVGLTAETPENGIAKLLAPKNSRRGITVTTVENGAQIDIYVIVEYGMNINVVSKNLSDQITYTLSEYAKVPVASVNVHVQGIKIRK